MTLKENWEDGNIVYASDLNEIASTVNNVASIAATEIQVSNYSASAGQLVPCDAAQGSFSVFLPEAPPDDSRVSVKKIDNNTNNAVTVTCVGSDRINVVGGETNLTLDVSGQVVTLQYDSYLAVWYVVSSDISTSTIGRTILQAADAAAVRTAIEAVSSSDSRLTDTRTPTDGSVSSAKLNSTFYATLATLTGSQTLTNKVLTDPQIASIYSPTNSTRALDLSAPTDGVNYISVAGSIASSHPQLGVAGSDTNINLDVYPKGSGALRVYGATGQTPTIQAIGADTDHNLNLLAKGAGTVQVGGVPVVTTTDTQTLTGKTISGSSNTLTNIAQSSVTNLTADLAGKMGVVSGGADNDTIGSPNKISVFSSASIGLSGVSQPVVPGNNSLSFASLRGGTVTITKNGSPTVAGVDYDASANITHMFQPNLYGLTLIPTNSNTVFVIEVDHTSFLSASGALAYGIEFRQSQSARSVTIEAYQPSNSTWVTVGSVTGNSSGTYAKAYNNGTPRTKVRYTLTDFITSNECRISSLFIVSALGLGPAEGLLPRNGGSLYGTSTAPPTLTATGSDANISLNLVSKGTGTVRANNIEVVTVSGTQTLTGKTITGYVPLNVSNQIAAQYLPTTSYATYVGNGSSTTYTVIHNLNTLDVVISVWDTATGEEVNCDKVRSTNGSVTLTFATPPSLNSYRVVILSNGNMGQTAGGTSSAWSATTLTGPAILSSMSGFTYITMLNTGAIATLPTAIGNSSRYVLKNITNANMTVLTTSFQTVEDQASLVLSPGASVEIVSDGSNWRII